MSVHYKFKSALEYDTVTFDGLHISVRDLKKAILHQKRIGKNTDFDLQVTNAQTKEGKGKFMDFWLRISWEMATVVLFQRPGLSNKLYSSTNVVVCEGLATCFVWLVTLCDVNVDVDCSHGRSNSPEAYRDSNRGQWSDIRTGTMIVRGSY